ncbi:DHH family phosphoesterase [Lactococcus nasutitermitis]|uniref:Cyclic-di-AMP phosphodiesterase n=1 Tax=Lactococcus nasutitermitis TaxID=1652957 RepID=A0ABV9J9Z2_9LACT|nr:DHH family phosphoesterase [Lactococcus nasutitermitis]
MNFVRRFSPQIIIAIMVIVQIFEILAVILSDSRILALVYLFLLNVIITSILLLQTKNYQLRRQDFIRKINDEAENSLNATLDNMPIGVIRYNKESLEPEWFNPFIDMVFKGNEKILGKEDIQAILKKKADEQYIQIGDQKFVINLDDEKTLIYLIDATKEVAFRSDFNDSRAVIGSISVDNYDDATDLITDSERTVVNNFIASSLENFATKYAFYLRRISSSRYFFLCDYRILDKMISDKFSVLNDFKTSSAEKKIPLTLSIGVSYGWNDFPTIGKTAMNNLELAQVRGGDQVVLRENTEQARPTYFGGNSESRTQKSRTRARAISTALRTIISEADDIFIVGHRFTDMDALGAAIAMKVFANISGKEAFVVYDPEQLLPDVGRAIDKMNKSSDGFTHIIRLETARRIKKANSLLIMVDHSKTSQTLNLDFYKSFEKVVVIDHHRRDDDFPEQALLSYIESSASSASELTVELLQFHDTNARKMSNIEASIALAGIEMDTKNFTKATTSRTFEAAAYLRSRGADNDLIKIIMATDFEKYKKVNEIVLNSKIIFGNIALGVGATNQKYDNITTAKAADTLLDMAGVTASFAITNHTNGFVSVSARSRNGFNVQTLMEQMGGGGHFNNAATQIYERTEEQVKEELIKVLKARFEINE